MRRGLAGLILLWGTALAGCATPRAAPAITGTGWGFIAEPRTGTGARRVLFTLDRYVCERSRHEDVNPDFTTPAACVPLTITRGEGYWLIPALYLPTGSYIGASTREACDGLERRQGRNLPLAPRGLCRAANIEPTP